MEIFAANMRDLPAFIERRLREVRYLDAATREEMGILNAEERALLDDITAMSRSRNDFNEEPLKEKFQSLMDRRQELLNSLEIQVKKVQHAYDVIDGRISFVGKFVYVFLFMICFIPTQSL